MVYSETIDGDAISSMRLALHSGQHDAALERITGELAAAKKQRRHYRVLNVPVLDVIANHRRGREKLARRRQRRRHCGSASLKERESKHGSLYEVRVTLKNRN